MKLHAVAATLFLAIAATGCATLQKEGANGKPIGETLIQAAKDTTGKVTEDPGVIAIAVGATYLATKALGKKKGSAA